MANPQKTKFNVLSPDGFPISREPFKSVEAAEEYAAKWCDAYKQQGFYSMSDRTRIPAGELHNHLRMVTEDNTIVASAYIMGAAAPNADTEASLHKLGQKLREGWEKEHPTQDKDVDFFKDAIREQWEKEQTSEREKPSAPDVAKEPEREPDEPEPER